MLGRMKLYFGWDLDSYVNLQFFHLSEEEEKDWGPGLTVSLTGQGEEIGQHLDEQ